MSKKNLMENNRPARKGGLHTKKTVSERGRQPRSLTDYLFVLSTLLILEA